MVSISAGHDLTRIRHEFKSVVVIYFCSFSISRERNQSERAHKQCPFWTPNSRHRVSPAAFFFTIRTLPTIIFFYRDTFFYSALILFRQPNIFCSPPWRKFLSRHIFLIRTHSLRNKSSKTPLRGSGWWLIYQTLVLIHQTLVLIHQTLVLIHQTGR